MKKIVAGLILLLAVFATQAQLIYTQEHLETLSQEDLNVYLDRAVQLQKSGRTLNIVGASILGGTVLTIAGVALTATDDWALGAVVIAFFGGLAGFGTLAVGIPMNLTGKNRVNRINALQATSFNRLELDLKPCAQYNLISRSYQPGLSVKIRF
ncbi:hypothetical protein INQ51_06895 [Maribellus sp. CM-23]|uniref:hypothetical protein n=1 Tax=Maribellus sp. CM-23 TaxID=2781026 RepID=UPI001F3BFB2A|nr:hypothetical protein [Maribellus sp. CM-23]MCE4564033.1 hypothetical protein [Maribellus sp. CM-23]